MLVIYHSRDSLPARHAAAMHVGRLPVAPPAGPEQLDAAWEALGGPSLLIMEGLWAAGSDARGRRVFAIGRASRADVLHRAFHGLAEIFDLPKRSFLLQRVGPPVAWTNMLVCWLHRAGLGGLARRVHAGALRKGWVEARRAVDEVAGRLAQIGEEEP